MCKHLLYYSTAHDTIIEVAVNTKKDQTTHNVQKQYKNNKVVCFYWIEKEVEKRVEEGKEASKTVENFSICVMKH